MEEVRRLREENKALREEIEETRFEMELSKVMDSNPYKYEAIVKSEQFRLMRQLIAVEPYYTSILIPIIKKYGYTKTNDYLLKRIDELEAKEAVKDIVE